MSPSKDEPATKKAKIDDASTDNIEKPKQQASLLNFFSSSTKAKAKEPSTGDVSKSQTTTANNSKPVPKTTTTETSDTNSQAENDTTNSVEAIVPQKVPPSSATWQSLHDTFVLVRRPRLKTKKNEPSNNGENQPRTKVAAFDLDGTLLQWVSDSPGFWPSQMTHYELWNENVIAKMRQLYDDQNYLLVIITNQGGIQGAHTGKKAGLLKSLTDWLESIVKRPLIVIASTKSVKKHKDRSFHKPMPKMWTKVLVPYFGTRSNPLDPGASFFVGDSADENDSQGGVDRKFATHAGLSAFYTPEQYFGPGNQELRQRRAQLGGGGSDDETRVPVLPKRAIEARKALLSGYQVSRYGVEEKRGPILLILAGVQGSGKSTFCRHVLFGRNNGDTNEEKDHSTSSSIQNNGWVWLSQDTINNGKPGKREKVEEQARETLRKGNSVLLDRMHLDPEQRQIMIENIVADEHDLKSSVRIHIVVLNPPKETVAIRVKNRTNHPGKVEGDKGVRIALQSMSRLVMPTYEEGSGDSRVELISVATTGYSAIQLAFRYHDTTNYNNSTSANATGFQLAQSVPLVPSSSSSSELFIPSITLGTMKIGRRICTETIQKMAAKGFHSIDTAPTYKNEDKIGEALRIFNNSNNEGIFVIAKIPKRATDAEQVRAEFDKTLRELKKKSVDLLLLHWPSDVIAQNKLQEVWTSMEGFVKEKRCKALGVCNFNEGSLMKLLRCCTIPPVLNQVERHPLLPQFGLLDFCSRHNIWMQAHTPLGGAQGKDAILNDPIVQKVAKETGLSPAQVVIRWNLQHGVLVVAKCSQDCHAKEILSCSESDAKSIAPSLSSKHMKALDSLGDDIKNAKRFVAPPFMYGCKAVYCWGERMPR